MPAPHRQEGDRRKCFQRYAPGRKVSGTLRAADGDRDDPRRWRDVTQPTGTWRRIGGHLRPLLGSVWRCCHRARARPAPARGRARVAAPTGSGEHRETETVRRAYEASVDGGDGRAGRLGTEQDAAVWRLQIRDRAQASESGGCRDWEGKLFHGKAVPDGRHRLRPAFLTGPTSTSAIVRVFAASSSSSRTPGQQRVRCLVVSIRAIEVADQDAGVQDDHCGHSSRSLLR